MTRSQLDEFQTHFGADGVAAYQDSDWRAEWASGLSGITMASDGYLPFRDDIEQPQRWELAPSSNQAGRPAPVMSRRVQAPTASG